MHRPLLTLFAATAVALFASLSSPTVGYAEDKEGCPVCAKVKDMVLSVEEETTKAQRVPRRVYALKDGSAKMMSYRSLLEELAGMDVVFVGEYHDDPNTHLMEFDLLAQLCERRNGSCAVGMEMFERDVQPAMDKYLRGEGSEEDMLFACRPWDNYPGDYRPIIEFCKERGLPFIASNTPTELVRRIGRQGYDEAIKSYTVEERAHLAADTSHPKDAYWERFKEFMGGSGSGGHGGEMTEEKIFQFYQSQCMKDDTMAESSSRLRERWQNSLLLHYSGSFHVDYKYGIPARYSQRRPSDKVAVVALRPADAWSGLDPLGEPGVADYVIFVPSPSWGEKPLF